MTRLPQLDLLVRPASLLRRLVGLVPAIDETRVEGASVDGEQLELAGFLTPDAIRVGDP
jgi:hypothetical protein